eukprot:CAMPEP_0119107076 /NCGR_PEP_ID=MMETSP1180-20130426/7935_1 /TAXON_ID=3052 ORGANISM="Chlamydomonas cf sp, Strain CCMP681" /NCGR_SAMPLE_ID=MMETSP1180 /ASSEMBLY_ACC=CAM_ASM_000741 /LENGTH=500 /DNA_ID=CAMNT_0007092509 /DNA_START=118 /DNA_END=1620 /DNA_ORIENTATION=-
MKGLFSLVQSAPCRIDLEFKSEDGKAHKPTTMVKTKKEEEEVPVYASKETVRGEIRITPMTTKKLEHQGIKIQLLGQIELSSERGTAHEFVSLVRELAPPGDLTTAKVFPFEFKDVDLQYDSYRGQAVRCRYLLRVSVTGKGMAPDARREFNIWVTNYEEASEAAAPIKMEVGIEDCLHIEFEYDKARYHLNDVVVGRIYFLLVRIKLKHMEVEIRRKETTGAGTAAHSDSETLAKYEIMDGAPVRGESVPIRLYLTPYDLAPTYRDVNNKFSVRYFLNLVLVDEEDRRYFKQQEITLFRKRPNTTAEVAANVGTGPPKLGAPPPAHPPAAPANAGTAGSSQPQEPSRSEPTSAVNNSNGFGQPLGAGASSSFEASHPEPKQALSPSPAPIPPAAPASTPAAAQAVASVLATIPPASLSVLEHPPQPSPEGDVLSLPAAEPLQAASLPAEPLQVTDAGPAEQPEPPLGLGSALESSPAGSEQAAPVHGGLTFGDEESGVL